MELYIHIPFCVQKCHYCDFLSFPSGEETREKYCQALTEEIKEAARALQPGPSVRSVFFGGGTPSVLTARQTDRLMQCIKKEFSLAPDVEISMEANPGTLDEEKLYTYRQAGINRLSIGLQSTRDQLLMTLGRIHTLHDFERSYDLARACGFDNINIDIMSALPGQTLDDYRDTLQIVTDYKPEHISSYSLIVEEGTPLAADAVLLETLPDEETDRRMYMLTGEYLRQKGYHRYEISNYALPGRECRHNIGYWDGTPYLGLGLGASSYYNHARFSNTTDLLAYLQKPWQPFAKREDYEQQSPKQEMEDRMIFGLRMMEGVSAKKFEEEFSTSMEAVYGKQIRHFTGLGLLEHHQDRVRLTAKGIDVSNRIFEELLLD